MNIVGLFLILMFQGFIHESAGVASKSYCRTASGSWVSGAGSCLSGSVFLKGDYIEVGIHSAGSFGTASTAPSTYTYSGKQLGFIADFDKNGFASSSPGYAGDYFVPGTPLEGNCKY